MKRSYSLPDSVVLAGRREFDAVLFDCDGVLVDSEPIANQVLADFMSEIGCPMTIEQSVSAFVGQTIDRIAENAERISGQPIAQRVRDELIPRMLAAFAGRLKPLPGIEFFVRSLPVPFAVASNSRDDRLFGALRLAGIEALFEPHIYSAYRVPHPKPAPDIYLFCADRLGVDPAGCLVFEDSGSGVKAARAAGMSVVGFGGGGHVPPDHERQLRMAGAIGYIRSWAEV